MALRFDFISDLDEQTKESLKQAGKYHPYTPLNELEIDITSISLDNSKFLRVVEVENKPRKRMVRIRVLIRTKTGYVQGVNVHIPYGHNGENAMRLKALDINYQVRNSEEVFVTFKHLYIRNSAASASLYFFSYDFRLRRPEEAEVDLPFPPKFDI